MVIEQLKHMIREPYRRLPYPWRKKWAQRYAAFSLTWHDPVLVYQMGKVGSKSVHHSLQAHGIQSVHVHRLQPEHLRALARRDHINIITLVREPIGRRMSGFFENLDRHVGADHNQVATDVTALIEFYLSKPYFRRPPRWFEKEMAVNLGIDVYAYPFPQEKGYQVIESGKYRLLILKLELEDALKAQIIADFLSLSHFVLTRANVAQDKSYADTYRTFVETIPLTEDYVDALCNARYTRHFYSEAEIEVIRRKWSR